MPKPRQARSSTRSVAVLSPQAASAVAKGHPWIYRQGLLEEPRLETGEVVDLQRADGTFAARGLWDESSPLAVRIYTRDAHQNIDVDFFRARFQAAVEQRERLFSSSETSAYRLCHGEGDRLPGLVIDRYHDVAVVRTDGDAMSVWLPRLAAALWDVLRERGVRSLAKRKRPAREEGHSEDTKLELLHGSSIPSHILVRENGVAMHVDLARGQKTGAFLDQRDNRARVRQMADGKRVLNLFSYAGGFSTTAALGGATHVTSVDIASAAHATAQRSMRENGLDPSAHTFVTADALVFLQSSFKRGAQWDLVICDPPSFAPSEKARPRALQAYRTLHRACAQVLAPQGCFCAASCSSHVAAEEFCSTLDDAALGRSDLSLRALYGAPPDHPTLAGWPEGRYLKFAVLS